MKSIFLALCWIAALLPCSAVETSYDWKALAKNGTIFPGRLSSNEAAFLEVENTNATELRVTLLKIENPPVSSMQYAVTGEIAYENVKGDGFLELWSVFAPRKPGAREERYFTRTLGRSGEMGKISGTSATRPFSLVFDRTGTLHPPIQFEINLILPGPGKVRIGPLKLVEYASSGRTLANSSPWWSENSGGWIGGIGGAGLGLLGGLLSFLGLKQKAHGFVIGTTQALIGVGVCSAVAGCVALATGQPYWVWSPLILIAAILLCVLPFRLRTYRHLYAEIEMRRMTAADAMGGR
jgi:hypothetical protein